jgi:predicted 3-demethylubiquinone-9 3-methyltransferase (glyoxalase superfamily)
MPIARKKNPPKRKSSGANNIFLGAPTHSITPFLMFNANPEEAAKFYVAIFKNSKVLKSDPMQAEFILNGQRFYSYNGGPEFQFSWGVSFMISVETQKEIDYYWNALLKDGGKESMCGWLQDKYGMWWQVTPKILLQLMSHTDRVKAGRAREAMLKMQKIDIAALESATKRD